MSFKEFLKKERQNDEETDVKTLSDKVFMRSITLSGLAILICIIALASSSFAWFSTDIKSTSTIQSAVYKLEMEVSSLDPASPTITESQNSAGNTVYTLSGSTEYKVTATAIDDETTTASSGYFKIVVDGITYFSEQIDRGETISFTLTFDTETQVEVIECWGTCSRTDAERHIFNGGAYNNMQ